MTELIRVLISPPSTEISFVSLLWRSSRISSTRDLRWPILSDSSFSSSLTLDESSTRLLDSSENLSRICFVSESLLSASIRSSVIYFESSLRIEGIWENTFSISSRTWLTELFIDSSIDENFFRSSFLRSSKRESMFLRSSRTDLAELVSYSSCFLSISSISEARFSSLPASSLTSKVSLFIMFARSESCLSSLLFRTGILVPSSFISNLNEDTLSFISLSIILKLSL